MKEDKRRTFWYRGVAVIPKPPMGSRKRSWMIQYHHAGSMLVDTKERARRAIDALHDPT